MRRTNTLPRLAVFAFVAAVARPASAQRDTVRAASGDVIGLVADGVASFKGIPYAAPPIDSLRWRPPVPPIPWTEPYVASDFGASCFQPLPVRGTPRGSRAATVSEDCLTLNVWTRADHAHGLPVMIWIHGGGNVDGTSGRTLYDGSHFAADSVVLVSINYRLGVFGFFAHPALTREAHGGLLANFALLDQLAAIRWVRRNITAFGGDTGNVTIFGESAGGQDVLALLTSPMSRGLFQKAIAESPGGGWGELLTLSQAETDAAGFVSKLHLPGKDATAAQLRSVPAQQLLDVSEDGVDGPIVDGKLLPQRPIDAFGNGHALDIPLIIGTNANEGSLLGLVAHPEGLFPRNLDGPGLTRLRALYGPAATSDSAFTRLMFRDGYFAGPVRWIAGKESSGAPVYLYRFDYVVAPFRATRLADHGSELPFIFENWPIPLMIPQDVTMERAMHDCWVAFARSGAPTCAGLPDWTRYQPADGKLMWITETPAMHQNPVAAQLDMLQKWLRH